MSESWRRTSEFYEPDGTRSEAGRNGEHGASELGATDSGLPDASPSQSPTGGTARERVTTRAGRLRSRFESDPRTQRRLGCVGLGIAVFWGASTLLGGYPSSAAQPSYGWLANPIWWIQLAFAIGLAATAVLMLWGGRGRVPSLVVLEITEDGLELDGRLSRWEEIARIELVRVYPIPAGRPAGFLAFTVSLVELRVVRTDGAVITVPREVLGTEPLGPWDEVVEAIRIARPGLPIVDEAGGRDEDASAQG